MFLTFNKILKIKECLLVEVFRTSNWLSLILSDQKNNHKGSSNRTISKLKVQ